MSLPNYFYEIPASSTGKYHPNFAHGRGGLIRHTKAVVHIALSLFRTELFQFTDIDKDIIISALILHDGLKNGDNGSIYTVKSHPQRLVKYIKERPYLTCPEIYKTEILNCIKFHMGKWNVNGYPRPHTSKEKFVHLCDYLASRPWISRDILKTY